MGTTQKSDGRYIVGKGISNANEYKGSMGYRDIVIQLTADGATAESVQKLNYLKDYAMYHSEKGEPIIPPNTQIWISGNGFSKAIEADDINISEDGISIGGIVYADDAWDYSHAGEGGGSGSGLPPVDDSDNGKLLGVSSGEWSVVSAPSGGGGIEFTNILLDDNTNDFYFDKTAGALKTAFLAGKTIYGKFVDSEQACDAYFPVDTIQIYSSATSFYLGGEWSQFFIGDTDADYPVAHSY